MKKILSLYSLILIAGIAWPGFFSLPAFARDAEKVQELQRIIEMQQKQNEAQQRQLEAQQKQLDAQRHLLQRLQTQIESLANDTDKQARSVVENPKTTAPAPVKKVVTSGGGDRIRLAISGQVNRAVNLVEDGKSARAYYVDNDNSESRVRFVGTAKATDDLTIGSKIELSIAPNKAGEVDRNNQ
jgi:hypothetical protein